ncbi:hypothetical protein Bca4012_065467 [Brassica carinata]
MSVRCQDPAWLGLGQDLECFESSRDKLRSIVCYNFVRDPMSSYDMFPDEVLDLCVFDTCVGFCFYPFGKEIRED